MFIQSFLWTIPQKENKATSEGYTCSIHNQTFSVSNGYINDFTGAQLRMSKLRYKKKRLLTFNALGFQYQITTVVNANLVANLKFITVAAAKYALQFSRNYD